MTKLLPYYFIRKIYLYFSTGSGQQPREPALCQLYRHSFVRHPSRPVGSRRPSSRVGTSDCSPRPSSRRCSDSLRSRDHSAQRSRTRTCRPHAHTDGHDRDVEPTSNHTRTTVALGRPCPRRRITNIRREHLPDFSSNNPAVLHKVQSINQSRISCIFRVVQVIKSLQDPLKVGTNLPGISDDVRERGLEQKCF